MSLSHEDVLQILALLDASDFDELRLETSDYKLHVRRSVPAAEAGTGIAASGAPGTTFPFAPTPVIASAPSGAPAPAPAAPPASPAAGTPAAAAASPPPAAAPATPTAALIDVKTPLLGTFYRSPQPGAPPFVEVGARVEPDTVIGIVEVMKLMSSVAAGAAGIVVEVLATDGQLVEYGEVLMRVAPAA